ncbi:MAG: hypothetical protein ACRERE_08200 [Candidatus Entotheonellia bacterium]
MDERDGARADQVQALSLTEEARDTALQARTKIALWATRRGGLVLVGRR